MEALVPAFIAALLIQIGDRSALLTAILADRFARPLLVALSVGLAHAATNTLAALAGLWAGPMLQPEGKALLLAFALLYAGVFTLFPAGPVRRLDNWRIGPVLTPLVGALILASGDRMQFLTFALAARSAPWFAAAGAILGSFAVTFVAAMLGEAAWQRIPLRAWRIGTGALFLLGGAFLALGALRLL